jgi:hypothetical protein
MADDPLDQWRETWVKDRQRAGLLAAGPVKNLLNKQLRETEVILQAVGTLPENDPFRHRVAALALRMKETPSSEAKERDDVLSEFAACAKIARSLKQKQAALDAAKRRAEGRVKWSE